MAISVDLGVQLEAAVNDLIDKGRYGSKSEVLREGVRLVQEREAKLAAFHAAIEAGLADADAGRTVSLEDAFAEVETRLDARLAQPAGFAEE
ncbi:type II toxin-antitoxin system ParD family antitoxin [uncultured Caulobacter sp.]|jgi:antitoxin ParD1/3/4|uniref:type II toxin-antitoxin system ParD family antitoxin n=1 Tax=uncultured Caulobacter sp. TaxID=158749 RepID=UPI002601F68D|nr:type II toxin-antitoxin system ParD family antitoxin [uncultured Caulobacter sp.]